MTKRLFFWRGVLRESKKIQINIITYAKHLKIWAISIPQIIISLRNKKMINLSLPK